MSSRNRQNEWSVLVGIGLLALGVVLLFNRVLGPLWYPFSQLMQWVGRIGWPLVLIAIGVLIISRARRGGAWDTGGRRLYRSRGNRMVGGVLAGFAEAFNADVTMVRIVYVLFTILTGFWAGFVLYIIAMIVMPEAPWVTPTATVTSPPPAPPVPPSPTEAETVPGAEYQAQPAPPAPPVPPAPPAAQ